MRKKLSVKAPAKINLALDVLHKRPDGFHEVEMVMTNVDLADRLELTELRRNEIIIESTSGFVPDDQRNLAFQAAALLKKKFNIRQGIAIKIDKQIPVAAGLAGGSSDAAATLRGLNELWELGLTYDELADIGSEIGSDVAFCVYGGTALAKGRGEIIKPIDAPPPCWVILAKPSIGVSTAEVYRRLRTSEMNHPDVKGMMQAIEDKNYEAICDLLGNVLEDVTLKLHPEVRQIKEKMESLGADGVLMSGSGPTVFGLTRHESRMQRIYNGLRGFCGQVYAVRLLGEKNP
ncbi:4-(cytidine 5'-diphospho)-2-C-methyl-D-erythritol kinase [Bacillus sp. N1-1]|jgi:4-diphosphocytidyl-2-C-methyl-D-erythritol kinase|uniref:4-(cytidine 5'-diphospho)-2-C-methyl-D-erythritol kinase n=1 Tax=Bacillus sp. N1-1 TaxID=2682541 RepID=UPI001318441D|nr:4-(cytidine 5'-diphospho)-2-C-methyl-D-erythritol kinase [Bacillus sp. N1-1]QHA90049.1 4-(cytidine 5'-diphospho)-2-C-methyl-D-erythritol kinase [Bacillus sp. N1-1]